MISEYGVELTPSPVLDTYFKFACERQSAFIRRVMGEPPPWTDNEIILAHRFTNPYRASDRVSQYLISEVQYSGKQSPADLFFRTILFKIFNRIDTWESLCENIGEMVWCEDFTPMANEVLDKLVSKGKSIYSAAYMMPNPPYGHERKHANHLAMLDDMMRNDVPARVASAESLEGVFNMIREWPSIGDFLAFQYTIDLNYSAIINFSEMDFVVAGPGALSGIKKCFIDTGGLPAADVIRTVAFNAIDEFERLGLEFQTLWGRNLQLIDFQNLFCETDKYARLAHPDVAGLSGRTRIKQRYAMNSEPLPQWYPPKWGVFPYGKDGG